MDKQLRQDHSAASFLMFNLLLANFDYLGLVDYSLKAILGGGIWLGYKVLNNYIEKKREKGQ